MMRYAIWLLLILVIAIRYFFTRPVYQNGDKVRITATVYTDPAKYSPSQYVKLAGLGMYLPGFPEIFYGNKIVVEGIVNGGKLEKPKLIIILKNENIFSGFRKKINDFYQNNLPQPESGLISGIVLGAKGNIDRDFYKRTKLTGVAHVVVASGTNIVFVASFLMGVCTIFLPRRQSIGFVIFGIISYLFISGFDAPLVRAAIMASVAFLAQETGRLVATWRIFFLTIGIMLAIKPDWLVDVGFLLSFASTAALLLFERKIHMKLKMVPGILRENLSTSIAAQIGVTPIVFVMFSYFNIWSPVINALVLWTVPALMIIGAIGGMIGIIFEPLGKSILYLGYPLLWWFVQIVNFFSK